MRLYRILPVIASLVLISGCAPVISKKTLEEANRSIKFEDIVKDPEKYKSSEVVLGGTIVNAQNTEEKTIVEVLQEPLNFQLKPVNPEESAGRFLIEYKGFKDPAIYSRNRRITVAGKLTGSETKKIGEMKYTYPVIEPKEDYLWSTGYAEPSVGVGVGVGIIKGY